jgi:hypothetical protein
MENHSIEFEQYLQNEIVVKHRERSLSITTNVVDVVYFTKDRETKLTLLSGVRGERIAMVIKTSSIM